MKLVGSWAETCGARHVKTKAHDKEDKMLRGSLRREMLDS